MGGGHLDSMTESATCVHADTVAELEDRIGILAAFTGGIVFEFDRNARYLRIFAGEPLLLVRPAEALMGCTINEVFGPARGERFEEAIRHVFDTGEQSAFEYELDVQAGHRTFSCVMMANEARAGRARTVSLLVRDITSAKALEAKLVQSERLAAIGLLAASVGHEIRQPLSFVVTSLDGLERELEAENVPPHARASFEKIRAAAGRIAEIAASLDLLAADRRRTTKPIDVRRPLQAALEQCAGELRGLDVESVLADVPLVRGNDGELCQVFANVLANAAQALEGRGAKKGILRVSTSAAGDGVRVSISDNGAGIAPDDLAHIFDPFFTTREQRGGTGLGLFITRGIVGAHGGTLEVKSEKGRGTTIDILLPIAAVADLPREPVTGVRPRPTELRAPESCKPAAATRRRLSVLVVDDEPRFLESLRLALDDAHAVETRRSAADALAILEAEPTRYDVVLCDLAMPDIDGVMFYERMRALGIEKRFVLMTGGAFTPSAAEFVRSGRCPSITKPFLLERLLALLDDVTQDQSAS